MTDLLLRALAGATLGLALVLVLRRPVRRWFGAGPGFTLWLLPLVLMLAPLLPRGAVPSTGWTLPAVMVTPDAMPATTAPQAANGVWGWLVALWLAGVALGLVRLAVQYVRLRRAVQPLPQAAQRDVQRLLPEVDTRRLRLHAAGPAVLFALPRALVLLPVDFAERFANAATRELVLRHELTHAQRGDACWTLAMEIVSALLWFHPLAWFARARFRLDQELACDAAAVRTCPRRSGSYARALLDSVAVQPVPALIPWLAEPQLKERIAMLVRIPPGTLRRRIGAFAVAALLVGGLFAAAGTMPLQAAPPPPPPPPPSPTLPPPPPPPPPPQDVTPSMDITFRNQHPPRYPVDAIKHGEQGSVILDVTIDRTGTVKGVRVDAQHTTAPADLQALAVAAARDWKFRPGIRDGHPVGGVVRVPVNFALHDIPPGTIPRACAPGYRFQQGPGNSYSCLAPDTKS